MGFDPRQWSSASQPRQRQRVTSNVESLLVENDALRHEVRRLHAELERLRSRQVRQHWQSSSQTSVNTDEVSRITASQIDAWGQLLSHQVAWKDLRLRCLIDLIERLNRNSFHPQLNLYQRLDRLMPGFGSELLAAMTGALTKKRAAVLAAFAFYGVRASEWLNEDPQRVVHELLNRQESTRSSRRTRSDQRSSDRTESEPFAARSIAYEILGLESGASVHEIKQAHRRLVKKHHPDLGGSAEIFRRINEAYQLLLK
jgi:hypothetical protein